jgi:hypothetical protein
MKNLFVITEEEKNRILGLHESATKNQYLISEDWESWSSSSDDKTERRVGKTLGFGIKSTMTNGCELVMLLDGNQYENLVCNVCPGGYLDFKIENDYKNTTITGNWNTDGQNVTIKMSDGTTFTGSLSDGSIKDQVLRWIMKQPKFIDYANKYSLSTKGWGELGKWDSYPCVVNHPNAKQEKTSKGGIIYLINNEYYYNNGRKRLSDGTMQNYTCNDEIFKAQAMPEPDLQAGVLKNAQACGWGDDVEGYKNSGWKCPKPGSSDKSKQNGEQQKPKYYQQITDLQTKVGAENTGTLDQATLKAIMDKLSQ